MNIEPLAIGKYSLTLYPIYDGRLSYSYHYWSLPDSYIDIPCFEIKKVHSGYKNIDYQIKWCCKELLEVTGISGGLILDARALENDYLPQLNTIFEEYREREIPIVIICSELQKCKLSESETYLALAKSLYEAFENLLIKLLHYDRIRKIPVIDENWLKENVNSISLPISKIRYQCYTWEILESIFGGYIKFIGAYGYGSDGDIDGLFIRLHIDEFFDRLEPEALIVDLQELEYNWGDALSVYPVKLIPEGSPIRIVVKRNQLKAFTGVVRNEDIRVDLEESLTNLSEYIKAKKISFYS